MEHPSYITFSADQLNKIGNTAIFLSQHIERLSKTKLLKLFYILDELSIKKSGIPFLNLKYKVWKFGPVSEELFIDLSSELKLLGNYLEKQSEDGIYYAASIADFNDDEFSESDIELMHDVIDRFGNKSAAELVNYTHRENSPWHTTAKAENVLELLESGEINNTEFWIDMSQLVAHDPRKSEIYFDFIERH
jgi:uncharacterized phage-associated protein